MPPSTEPQQCPRCDLVLSCRKSLLRHIDRVHDNVDTYDYVRQRTQGILKPYACKYCTKTYARAYAARRHSFVNHGTNEIDQTPLN